MTDAPARSHSTGSHAARRIMLLLIAFIAIVIALWYTGAFKPRPKIALVTASQGPYWDMIVRGAQDSAERYKLDLTVIRAHGDEEEQTAAIRGLLGQGYNGIAISPNNPMTQGAILSEVAGQTNLVTFDSDSEVAGKICHIGTNNYDAGRECGKLIAQAIPDGGDVLLCIGSLDKDNGKRRRQGVIDELLDRTFEPARPMDAVDATLKGPKYTIVATIVDGIDPTKAAALAADALKQHPNVKCCAGLFAYNTPALLKALADSGKTGKVQIVGFDTYDQTLDGIESGTVFASVAQDPYNIGREAVRVLGDAANGDRMALPMFSNYFLATDDVTKANVATVRQDLAKKMKPATQPAT
jgi:ribose transport system substrate-binding protein